MACHHLREITSNLSELEMVGAVSFDDLIHQLRHHLIAERQRALVRISGAQDWVYQQLQPFLDNPTTDDLQVLSFLEPTDIQSSDTRRRNEWRLKHYPKSLGKEFDIVIIDAFQGFNLNAFAALSGVLPKGGLLILLSPDDEAWLTYDDPEANRFLPEGFEKSQLGHFFMKHFLSQLRVGEQQKAVIQINSQTDFAKLHRDLCVKKGVKNESLPTQISTLIETQLELNTRLKTDDQKQIAKKINELLLQTADSRAFDTLQASKSGNELNERSTLLICADRGRGKSSVIGITLAFALSSSDHQISRIALTAAKKENVDTLLQHFQDSMSELVENGNQVKNCDLQFVAADKLLESNQSFDLIIIDEVAAMPANLVQQLVLRSTKSILATTIQGYEGTGRSFEFKLKPWLANNQAQLEYSWMSQPIRWQQNDRLEPFINASLCLADAQTKQENKTSSDELTDLQLKHYTPSQIIEQNLLPKIFGLLTNAHYQTTPNDLRAMLDNPANHIFTIEQTQSRTESNEPTLFATMLVCLEGGEPLNKDRDLTREIAEGRRRPRGHLTPQSLSAHCGFEDATQFTYARVVRIAVEPEYQGKGIGSVALEKLANWFQNPDINHVSTPIDFMATSFGCEASLLSFWLRNQYLPVRLGLKKETATAEYSALMLNPLSVKAQKVLPHWHKRFNASLIEEQSLAIRNIEPTTLDLLHSNAFGMESDAANTEAGYENWSTQQSLSDLRYFADHFRSMDSCILAFTEYRAAIIENNLLLLKAYYLDGQDQKTLIKAHGLSGEKDFVRAMRQEAKSLLKTIKPH